MFLVWFPGYLVPDPGWMRWGGRPPYGYQLADAGPHPNKAHAAWGRRAHRLEPDPETAPQVAWIFANDCPGTAWPGSPARSTRPGSRARRLPTRSATRIAAAELGRCTQSARSWPIPRYTGRQVWNRQRTDSDLVDPANTGLGHRAVQRWNRPEGWVISTRPAHPAILSETDYIAAQDLSLRRGPDSPAARCYRLAGLLRRGICGRLLESCWSNGKAAYRCRHGHTSATSPGPARPEDAYIREAQILPRLAALAILLRGPLPADRSQEKDNAHGPGSRRGGRCDCLSADQQHHTHLRPAPAHPPGQHPRHCSHHHRPEASREGRKELN